MVEIQDMVKDLKQHMAICHELLDIIERESQSLCSSGESIAKEHFERKKLLLPQLNNSVAMIRKHRMTWQGLSKEQRGQHAEFSTLVRQCQDLIMKIITLDRENEQGLLRRGLVPNNQLPSANRQRPNYVADVYRRSGAQ